MKHPFQTTFDIMAGAPSEPAKPQPESEEALPMPETPTAGSQESFRFLDLPPELRNIVYTMIAEKQTATITKHTLADHSGLQDIKELKSEYTPIFMLCAPVITAAVLDFDFRNIVSFFNKLTDAEHNKLLPSAGKQATRKVTIKLHIEQESYSNNDLLMR